MNPKLMYKLMLVTRKVNQTAQIFDEIIVFVILVSIHIVILPTMVSLLRVIVDIIHKQFYSLNIKDLRV